MVNAAKQYLARNINQTVVRSYYEIGRMIVEEEQDGTERAAYAKKVIEHLSQELTKTHGKGYSIRNLEQMRKFYLTYAIPQTVSAELRTPDFQLSWSHYLMLTRINDVRERRFYEIEAAANNWSVRELKRQFDSALYERLALSRDKEGVKRLSEEGLILEKPADSIKDPLILEFFGFRRISKILRKRIGGCHY